MTALSSPTGHLRPISEFPAVKRLSFGDKLMKRLGTYPFFTETTLDDVLDEAAPSSTLSLTESKGFGTQIGCKIHVLATAMVLHFVLVFQSCGYLLINRYKNTSVAFTKKRT